MINNSDFCLMTFELCPLSIQILIVKVTKQWTFNSMP